MSQFFISGVQRSGTTLLAVMLSNHPDILIERRVMSFQVISAFKRLYDILPYNMEIGMPELMKWLVEDGAKSRLPDLLDIGLLTESESISEWINKSINQKLKNSQKSAWGDKSPNLEYYHNDASMLFPNARVIHIVRDGRPVAYSMHTRGATNLLLSAQRWADGNSQALVNQQIVGHDKYLIIKYEDLLIAPEKTLRKVCSFLQLHFSDQILIPKDDQVVQGENYVKKKVDLSKIDKWKSQLSKREIRKIEEIQGPTLTRFGYKLETPKDNLRHRPLSAFRFIMYKQSDSIKSLFVGKRMGMIDRKNVEINIPLKIRLYSFLKVGAESFLSPRIFKALFSKNKVKNIAENR